MADHILAEAKIIPLSMAGKIRYLDYLLEEQKRGITMKTSVISFFYTRDKKRYLIHLCDTPGHIDFSGKVSRILRLVDGLIIIVDAVEGVMAQTETYLRLALKEAVRPILFINKIDRLITELNASEFEIFRKISQIISRVNQIIRDFAPKPLQDRWVVQPENDTIIFGSALHGWGFTYSLAKNRNIKFSDIINTYRRNESSKLKQLFPLGKILLNIIIDKLPSPLEAQKYRVKYIWTGNIPDYLQSCEVKAPTIFYVAKTKFHRGQIFATARVFSGTVTIKEYIRYSDSRKIRPKGLFILQADKAVSISSVPVGNIFGIVIDSTPGETFGDIKVDGSFKKPTYTAYPVLAVAIEPQEYSDIQKLLELLKKFKIEDPNIEFELSRDTGQIIIYGIGELHLEVIISEINKHIPIFYSTPIVAFKELPKYPIEANNGSISIKIAPKRQFSTNETIVDLDNTIEISGVPLEKIDAIQAIIKETIKYGPKIREPLVATKITITVEKYDENKLLETLSKALGKLDTYILQPYYRFNITTDCGFLGNILTILSQRNARIINTSQSIFCEIVGEIPVLSSLGLANSIRGASQGRASIQLEYIGYKIVTRDQEQLIYEYLSRKHELFRESNRNH